MHMNAHADHNTMITVFVEDSNPFSQEIYDKLVDSLQLHTLSCSCGRTGCMKKYGHYQRTFKHRSGSFRLKVQRLICSCTKTHAVLVSIIVPYQQIPRDDQQQILSDVEQGRSPSHIMEENPGIDENNIISILRNYRKHWKERLRSLGLGLSDELVKLCFQNYSRQFLQIKTTPNKFYLRPT